MTYFIVSIYVIKVLKFTGRDKQLDKNINSLNSLLMGEYNDYNYIKYWQSEINFFLHIAYAIKKL